MGEGERERNISVWLPLARPILGTWPPTPGRCPDWELDQQPFDSQGSTQSTEPHQPGYVWLFKFPKYMGEFE